ncbi:MAG TPA: GNAT family N-acetyltransferase [Casimicrobiaceae bacterium]|nr:GNAT family N-acetyltransferase [Casimicrobiaceae bacterium]
MNEAKRFDVRLCAWADAADALREVRRVVFVVEQGVPEALEFDAADLASIHALAEAEGGAPIGCARLLADGHIGRVAVLAQWRGFGIGRALMHTLIARAAARGDASVIVNAQVQAMPFYARDGFVATGDAFLEAGIAHRVMTRALR